MIVFVENNTNFILYCSVAKVLSQKYGIDCHILTLSRAKKLEIESNGVPATFLGDVSPTNSPSFESINRIIENENSAFTLAQYLNQDRHLTHYSYEKSLNLIRDYSEKFYAFAENNNVQLFIGELTWANELVFMNISEYVFRVPYVDLLNNYVFNEPKLTFFDAKHSLKYMKLTAPNSLNHSAPLIINIENFVDKRINTDINKIFSSFSNYSATKYKEKYLLIKKYGDKYDYKYDFYLKFRFNILKILNRFTNSVFEPFLFQDTKLNERFFYFPLHIQPEATPDIVAPFYNNQIDLIEKISLSLPLNTYLYVKDHPDGLGYRSFFYYNNIVKLKNVRLIKTFITSSSLIKNSLGVLTIAGTAGIEARLLSKPVIVFSDIFYQEIIDHVYLIQNFNELPDLLKKISTMNGICKSLNIKTFIDFVENNSFKGYVYDPIIDPNVLDKKNIESIAFAISTFKQNLAPVN